MTGGGEPDPDAAAHIRAEVAALDAAFNRGDVEAVLSFYHPNALLVVRPGQMVRGYSGLRKVFTTLVQQGSGVRVLSSEVLIGGDTALFVARWTIHRDNSGRDEYHTATSVLRRGADGRWKLLIDNAFGPRVLDTRYW